MNATLKKIDLNNYELTIEIGGEELKSYIKTAEKKIAQEVQVDGFRKGKVPRDLIRQKVGDKYILEASLDIAVHSSLDKAIQEGKLDVLKISQAKIKENSASKLVYSVQLLLSPKVTIGDLSSLRIIAKSISVDSKEVENTLDLLRSSRATFADKDGSAERGDRVELDFEVTVGGLPIEGGISKNHPLIIGDNKFIPGFEDQLVGLTTNSNKSFSLIAPSDYFDKSIAGKKLDFKVKVINIQASNKPPLDDNFARQLGEFKDLNELKASVTDGILQEKSIKEKNRLRIEILSQISAKSNIELPQSMIAERLDGMLVNFDQELHHKGLELSMYLAHLNKTQDDLRKDWLPEAEKQLKFHLILQKIAKDNGLAPSPEEVETRMAKVVQTMAMNGQLGQDVDLESIKNSIVSEMINEKTLTFLENKYSRET